MCDVTLTNTVKNGYIIMFVVTFPQAVRATVKLMLFRFLVYALLIGYEMKWAQFVLLVCLL